ncbi:hypothetical protein [Lysobacter xanthus]
MTEQTSGYAVFLYDQALEALGEPIKPYVQQGTQGAYVPCHEVDTGGAFVELTVRGRTDGGAPAEIELMIPQQMVRMIVSTHSDAAFGFAARHLEPGLTTLPVVGPAAPPASEPSAATPHGAPSGGPKADATDDRRLPPEG